MAVEPYGAVQQQITIPGAASYTAERDIVVGGESPRTHKPTNPKRPRRGAYPTEKTRRGGGRPLGTRIDVEESLIDAMHKGWSNPRSRESSPNFSLVCEVSDVPRGDGCS